jgi:GT2 family glycosyltransferase
MDMSDAPLVDIVLINWNAETVTAECLQSIRNLTYPNHRVILVDNGSSDRSGQGLSKRFPEAKLIQMERNVGFTGGNNAGMRQALADGADYILLLNNDTTVAPDLLNQMVTAAESDMNVAVVSPKIMFFDMPDRIWYAAGSFSWWLGMPSFYYKRKEQALPDRLEEITFATGCAMLLRAEALNKVGLFDERFFIYGEDADLTTRMLKAGYRAVFTPHAKVWHKDNYTVGRQQGVAFKIFLSTRNRLLLMSKHAKPWQWLTFLPSFFFRHILFFFLLGFWRRNLQMSWATLTGCYAFLRGRYGGSRSPRGQT